MVTDAFRKGDKLFTLPDGSLLSVALSRVRKPKIRLKDNTATVELYLSAEVTEPHSLDLDSAALKRYLETHMNAELNEIFRALQSVNSDAMGFGRYAARRFQTVEAWEAYDWKAAYQRLNAAFSVQLRLLNKQNRTERTQP